MMNDSSLENRECTGCGITPEKLMNEEGWTEKEVEDEAVYTNWDAYYCHRDCYRDCQ